MDFFLFEGPDFVPAQYTQWRDAADAQLHNPHDMDIAKTVARLEKSARSAYEIERAARIVAALKSSSQD